METASPFWYGGALKQDLGRLQGVQALEIVGQTDQSPLASSVVQVPKRKLAEAQHFLDDANHRFHRGFAQAVERITDVGTELVGHFLLGGSILVWRRRFMSKESAPTLMMRRATCSDVGVNVSSFQALYVVLTEITRIQVGGFQLSYLCRHAIDGG